MDFSQVCRLGALLGVCFRMYATFLLKGMTVLTGLLQPPIGGLQWGDVEVLAIPGLVCCARVTFEQPTIVSMKLPSSPACADASQDTD